MSGKLAGVVIGLIGELALHCQRGTNKLSTIQPIT
jgi:hypothetical protein